MIRHRKKALLALLLLLACLPCPAGAEETADGHEEEGARLYQDKEYERAIKEFQAAYSLTPQPRFLFNIGQSYRRLGLSQEAMDFYERYLQEEPHPDPTIKADLKVYIAQAQAAQGIAQKRQPGDGTPEPPPPLVADEVIDAEELFDQAVKEFKAGNIAVSTDLLNQLRDVYAQRHDPLILYYFGQAYEKMGKKKEALEAYERYIGAEPKDQQRRTQAAARVAALTPAPPGQKFLWPSLGFGILGIGGVVTGIVFFTQASANFDSYAKPGTEADKRGLRDNGNNLGLGSVIGYSVGGAFLAGAAVFLTVALVKGVKSRPLSLPKGEFRDGGTAGLYRYRAPLLGLPGGLFAGPQNDGLGRVAPGPLSGGGRAMSLSLSPLPGGGAVLWQGAF